MWYNYRHYNPDEWPGPNIKYRNIGNRPKYSTKFHHSHVLLSCSVVRIPLLLTKTSALFDYLYIKLYARTCIK